MITSEMLNALQADVSEVGNLLDALEIIGREVDHACHSTERRALNGLQANINAAIRQVAHVHVGFEAMFTELRKERQ